MYKLNADQFIIQIKRSEGMAAMFCTYLKGLKLI